MADSIILFPSKSHIANKAGTVVTFNATNKTLVSSNTGTIAFTDFADGDITSSEFKVRLENYFKFTQKSYVLQHIAENPKFFWSLPSRWMHRCK